MKSKHFFATSLICFISSCSVATDNSIPQNVDAPTTIPDPTTTATSIDPKFSSDPQEALDQLAEFDNAVDQSRISESDCGKFALTVGPKGLRSYKWQTDRWTHLSAKFETEFDEPYLITTRNFNYRDDEVKEFLINFDQDGSSGSMFGALLTLTNCDWNWAEIETPSGTSKTIRYLSWNDEQSQLTGSLIDASMELPALIKYSAGNFWVADYKPENSDTGYGSTSCDVWGDGTKWIDNGGTFSSDAGKTTYKCNNGEWTLIPSSNSGGTSGGGGNNSQNQPCQDPTSGMLVKNGASIRYSDGTRTCVNGKWSNPSGGSSSGSSSQTTKRAVKLQNCAGENEIQCRVLFSDGSVGYWTTRTSGQVVDVWEYFWGGGRWCVRLYENGGIQKLLC